MNFKNILTLVVACVVSFSVGKFSGPAEVKQKESTKASEDSKSETKKNLKKKETVLPDGTKITETDYSSEKKTDSSKKEETKKESHVKTRPNWRVNAVYFPKIGEFQSQNVVIDIQRRIISEVYVGLSASTQKQIGVSLSIGF